MGLLSKAEILGADDLPFRDVPVPEWGGSVRVRTMNGKERDEFRAALASEGPVPVAKLSAVLLVATCVDENGVRLFTMEDMEALQAKCATALDAPAGVAMQINGLAVSAVDDAAKNFKSGQSDDSGSDLPKS
jgi:hypothetical protein